MAALTVLFATVIVGTNAVLHPVEENLKRKPHIPPLVATNVIYEPHHWHYATELTTANVDEFVKTNVDKGKTVFIRWVASTFDQDSVTQAPCWNDLIRNFFGNADVIFGDVNFKTSKVDKIHGVDQSAGVGGWPTIRHFNKGTGYGGKGYERKTKEPLCDELGLINKAETDFLRRHMEDVADTFLCTTEWHVTNGVELEGLKHGETPNTGCNYWHREYINHFFVKVWDSKEHMAETIKKEAEHLEKQIKEDSHLKDIKWAKQRLAMAKELYREMHDGEHKRHDHHEL